MAYWSDSGNALNDIMNILPDAELATKYSSSRFILTNRSEVVSHINAGDYAATYGGVVDFIFPEIVEV